MKQRIIKLLRPLTALASVTAVPALSAADLTLTLDPAKAGAEFEGIGAVSAAGIRTWSSEHGEWDWNTRLPFLWKRAASINNTFLERGLETSGLSRWPLNSCRGSDGKRMLASPTSSFFVQAQIA